MDQVPLIIGSSAKLSYKCQRFLLLLGLVWGRNSVLGGMAGTCEGFVGAVSPLVNGNAFLVLLQWFESSETNVCSAAVLFKGSEARMKVWLDKMRVGALVRVTSLRRSLVQYPDRSGFIRKHVLYVTTPDTITTSKSFEVSDKVRPFPLQMSSLSPPTAQGSLIALRGCLTRYLSHGIFMFRGSLITEGSQTMELPLLLTHFQIRESDWSLFQVPGPSLLLSNVHLVPLGIFHQEGSTYNPIGAVGPSQQRWKEVYNYSRCLVACSVSSITADGDFLRISGKRIGFCESLLLAEMQNYPFQLVFWILEEFEIVQNILRGLFDEQVTQAAQFPPLFSQEQCLQRVSEMSEDASIYATEFSTFQEILRHLVTPRGKRSIYDEFLDHASHCFVAIDHCDDFEMNGNNPQSIPQHIQSVDGWSGQEIISKLFNLLPVHTQEHLMHGNFPSECQRSTEDHLTHLRS